MILPARVEYVDHNLAKVGLGIQVQVFARQLERFGDDLAAIERCFERDEPIARDGGQPMQPALGPVSFAS